MSEYKWFGGFLGWITGGPIVGLIGFILGSLADKGNTKPNSPYTVLGIPATATDEEVKSAYRRLAMQNHPDKVASLGPGAQKAAETKFRRIQSAYESIKKQRGIK